MINDIEDCLRKYGVLDFTSFVRGMMLLGEAGEAFFEIPIRPDSLRAPRRRKNMNFVSTQKLVDEPKLKYSLNAHLHQIVVRYLYCLKELMYHNVLK